MELDRRVCDRARRSRDARFDGRFFIGVTTTGIYCRPICPARAPKDAHVRYFPSAAAAEAAGFRPCFRCRPEASPGTPAWLGTSGIVSRALRLIADGALDDNGVERLADRLGVTARHLRRLFLQHLGATPLEVALTRRVHFAKKLLDETTLSCSQVAFAAGFGSLRRFNGQIRRVFERTPTELRRLTRQHAGTDAGCYRFRLAYRPPFDWDALLEFLEARATPGVESVDGLGYRRTITVDGRHGAITVSRVESGAAIALDVRFPDPRALLFIVERVRRMFDLGADPLVIGEHLRSDPLLRALSADHPGIRVPGAWDGFELAVRAILGQQISVRAATTIAGRIAAMFGSPVAGSVGLERLFPTPAQLATASIERAGVVPARAETIRSLARHVAGGTLVLGTSVPRNTMDAGTTCQDWPSASAVVRKDSGGRTRRDLTSASSVVVDESIQGLTAIRGIGAWTAEYIAMRAFGEPDAFPSGDLVLRRMTGARTARELQQRSETWRPWRAYAVMLLWRRATEASRRPAMRARRPRLARIGRERDSAAAP
jgi:AraC family transcriptional regulator, regulatory protein of adaptative response / DNA-3-methyladenine glycosylase II